MAHSNTSDNWGTAAVTVQQSSVPPSPWQHLPCQCVLHPAFPIPIRNRRGGQPCWCTSWTVIFPPQYCTHRALLKTQWDSYSSEVALCLPHKSTLIAHHVPLLTAGPSPAPNTSNSTFPVSLLIQHQKLPDPWKKEHLSQQVSWAPQEVFALLCLQISSHLSGQPGHSSPPDVNAGR